MIGIVPESPTRVIMELMPLGSLLSFLRDNFHNINPNTDLQLWAFQIADGMSYIANKKIIHRNLAARNILLQSKVQAKISDFESICILSCRNELYQMCSNQKPLIKWMPPELLSEKPFFSLASDVWSFGVTLWEIYSKGLEPYGDMGPAVITEFVLNGKRLTAPEQCPASVFRMMQKCWLHKPEDRPSFIQIVDFFRYFEQESLIKENVLILPDIHERPTENHIGTNIDVIRQSFSNKILNEEDLELNEKLGIGKFGNVFKGVYHCKSLELKIPVAIKTLEKDKADINQENLLKEFSIMLHLNHPNIITLIGK